MILCGGIALAGLISYVLCVKKGRRKDLGIYFLVLMISGILGVLVCPGNGESGSFSDEVIERPEPGESALEQDYELTVEDLSICEPYRVTVENRHLTKRELEELFTQAIRELERTFLGKNDSFDHITHDVVLADSVLEGRVAVSWSFDNYEAVNLEGKLQEAALNDSGSLVSVTAVLDYESVQAVHSFSMMVFLPEKTPQEQFYMLLRQVLEAQNATTEEKFVLPEAVAGHALVWSKKQKKKQYLILMLGLCAMAGIAVGRKEDARKARMRREALLLAEYPQMLSQMALLLAAGMTVSHAWERIVLNYENKCFLQDRASKEMPVYEEMRMTYHQIKDGLGERRAYEQFGERLQLQVYRRFSTLLVQNLRKGTVGLSKLLEKEMQEALDAQESMIKKRGEELETKLLLPMMLMLGLVIVIIMIPAIASFQL